ncbi:MAG: hypothetical protein F4X25_10260 [Chloroflexi bacterium]|nr:hypothetical protein [Chloroflexota bacterium]
MTDMMRRDGAAGGLRAGLLLLVVLGVVGSALALAYERHWLGAWQLAPWITLGIISVATLALVVRRTTATVWLARAVAVLAIVSAALGVWQHIDANLATEPAEDQHSHSHSHGENEAGDASMVDVVTGSAGHAPVPAALAIAPVGLALGLATIGLGERRPLQE